MARTRQGQGETLSGTPVGQFTNFAQKPIQSLRAPTTADTGYKIGQLWVDTSTANIFGLGEVSGGIACWDLVGSGFDGDEIEEFSESPNLQSTLTTGAAPTGATENVNLMCLQQGIIMEQYLVGAQTIIAPRMSSKGLEVALDQTINKGAEYNFGSDRDNARHVFTIGTSPAFFFEVKFNIEDISAADAFIIGFRINIANNLDRDSYNDFASIGMDIGNSLTNVVTIDQASFSERVTDTTDAWGGDDTANRLRVSVNAGGVVTYTINGNAPTFTRSYTFASALIVIPFMRFEQGPDLSLVRLQSMKVGFECNL